MSAASKASQLFAGISAQIFSWAGRLCSIAWTNGAQSAKLIVLPPKRRRSVAAAQSSCREPGKPACSSRLSVSARVKPGGPSERRARIAAPSQGRPIISLRREYGTGQAGESGEAGCEDYQRGCVLKYAGINVYELFYQEEDTGFSVGRRGGVRIVPFPWMRHVRFWSCII